MTNHTMPDAESSDGPSRERRAPRLSQAWLGVTLSVWIKVLARYRFPVSVRHFSRFLYPSLLAPLSSFAAAVQRLQFGRRIARARIEPHPLFILGFLRTGTTLLHELLALDERHIAPSLYQCLTPGHFVASHLVAHPFVAHRIPSRRPMDNMAMGFSRPFEDEFATCLSGHDSIYMFLFFPKSAGPHAGRDASRGNAAWRKSYIRFLKGVMVFKPGRLVLKSPPHTLRVDVLLEMFPDARFVHMIRDPVEVIPSALHTVRVLNELYGLQTASEAEIEEWVFGNFDAMHRSLETHRRLLTPERFLEVRYESLVADPVAELEKVYSRLDLGEFARTRPAVEQYLAGVADYRRNRFTVDAALRRKIQERCGWVIERYGYGRG